MFGPTNKLTTCPTQADDDYSIANAVVLCIRVTNPDEYRALKLRTGVDF